MYSLFQVKFSWPVYLISLLLIRVLFMDITWLSFFAIAVTLHQFFLLFYSFGHVLPIRYLLGSFMCLQMFLGPAFAYNGLDEYQLMYYKMQVPEEQYFAYALPAVILFILGLHFFAGKFNGERIDKVAIQKFVQFNPKVPYIFIAIGFISSIVAGFFGSELGFVFVLLGGLKFIGTSLLILGNKKLKPLTLIAVYGAIFISSLSQGMFHDLLIWLIFLGAVFALKYQPTNIIKGAFVLVFMTLATFIQLIKSDYRESTWKEGQEAGLETLGKVIEEDRRGKEGGIFSVERLAESNIRINQGFIVTNIMVTVPEKQPYENGEEMLLIVQSAILPRLLAPNKLNAGDRKIFTKYTGIPLQKGTSMGLSSMGDAYVNWGEVGGSIFMFFYGLFFSWVLNSFAKHSYRFPILMVLTPLVFYYPIRPDCELQTILGHVVKSSFLIFVMLQVWKHHFFVNRRIPVLQPTP